MLLLHPAMATNAQVIHAALVHLGFLMEAAIFIQDDHGMGSLEELSLLTDDDVETLCKVTHHPGGTANDPNVPDPQAGPQPGHPACQKLVSYYLKYREKTSRIATLTDITLSDVHELREHCDWELAHKDVEPPEMMVKNIMT